MKYFSELPCDLALGGGGESSVQHQDLVQPQAAVLLPEQRAGVLRPLDTSRGYRGHSEDRNTWAATRVRVRRAQACSPTMAGSVFTMTRSGPLRSHTVTTRFPGRTILPSSQTKKQKLVPQAVCPIITFTDSIALLEPCRCYPTQELQCLIGFHLSALAPP